MKRRTKISFETERLLVITRRRKLVDTCANCGEQARLLTVEEAAALARLNALAVYRLVEAGALHYTETATGGLLICAASLEDFISKQQG